MSNLKQNTSLDGKVIWLTGAAGGLAHGVALRLSSMGAKLALHFRKEKDFTSDFANELEELSANYIITSGDLSQEGIAANSVNNIINKFGSVYAFVHMAGPYAHGRITEFSRADFDNMIAGNLTTFFECSKNIAPYLQKNRSGRIIGFGMAGAQSTSPMRYNGAHLAAKSALTSLAKTLALELAPDKITVNIISPGRIDDKSIERLKARNMKSDDTFPMPGFASWEDIADTVLFLLAPSSDYITGSVIDVAGGWMGDDFYLSSPK